MPSAVFNGVVIAETEETVMVEGNHYFPPESLKGEYFSETPAYNTTCPWKGVASYYDVEVDGERAPAVAWTYRDPSERASMIKDHVAFYPKVRIEGAPGRGLFSRG
jgi:uncharacterized protein (DUF427 family)